MFSIKEHFLVPVHCTDSFVDFSCNNDLDCVENGNGKKRKDVRGVMS